MIVYFICVFILIGSLKIVIYEHYFDSLNLPM